MPRRLSLIPSGCVTCLSPEAFLSDLEAVLQTGKTELALSCPPAEGSGPYRVLQAVSDLLLEHPEIKRLNLLCRQEDLAAYRLQWNMWFSEQKGEL